MPSILLASKAGLFYFLFHSLLYQFLHGRVQVDVIHNRLLDSNEGDLSLHASQTIYFSNINENKISDRETPVELLSLEPQYGTEPLLMYIKSSIWSGFEIDDWIEDQFRSIPKLVGIWMHFRSKIHFRSKFGNCNFNWWWVMTWISSKWGKFWL